MNIIWKKPDGGVAVTHLTDYLLAVMREAALADGIITEDESIEIDATCRAHANQLLERGDVPSDWVAVAFNIELPKSRDWREAWTWQTDDPVVDICPVRAAEVTKNRLREERAPILASLDVEFMRAMESGDTSKIDAIKKEKQRLRDITALATPKKSLDELSALTVK